MKRITNLLESQEFYKQFFLAEKEISYGNYERYKVIFELIDTTPLPPSPKVLDIGSGNGRISRFLANRFDYVISIDIVSTNMMQYVLNECSWIRFCLAALPELPYPDHSFDLIVCSEVLEHLEPSLQPLAINEIGRLVAPGKCVILSTPNPRSLCEIIRRQGAMIKRGKVNRIGQLVEHPITPHTLRSILENEFIIEKQVGSYYLFYPLTRLARTFSSLYRISDRIRNRGWLTSRGLYQYYALRRKMPTFSPNNSKV